MKKGGMGFYGVARVGIAGCIRVMGRDVLGRLRQLVRGQ